MQLHKKHGLGQTLAQTLAVGPAAERFRIDKCGPAIVVAGVG